MRSHCHCILSRIICYCKPVFRLFILISFASGWNVRFVSVQFFSSFCLFVCWFCFLDAPSVAINLFVSLISRFFFKLETILFLGRYLGSFLVAPKCFVASSIWFGSRSCVLFTTWPTFASLYCSIRLFERVRSHAFCSFLAAIQWAHILCFG